MEECQSDPTISGLLSMAEAFLSQSPAKVSEAVRCLLAVLSLHPPARVEAKTRLQLGLTLYHHTNNLIEAREHLDKALLVAQSAINLQEVTFEATSISARILVEQQSSHSAKSLLRGRLESSSHYPYWHIRLLLQLADVCMNERDERGVTNVLNKCAEYARQVDAPYTRLLCSLCKGAVLLTHHHYQEAGEVLNHTSGLMEEYHGEKEPLIRTFYLIVQVSHLLVAGQVKAAKPHLKQLQQRVKAVSSDQSFPRFSSGSSLDSKLLSENFQWLTREQTFIMVYLVSVMHSVQGGYLDKALSYAEKAMHVISQESDTGAGHGVVSVLRAHLLEQIIQCMLMKGDTAGSAEKIQEVLGVCHEHPQLVYTHRAVLHTLLGLYAFASDNLDRAAVQFHTALQHTNSGELRAFASMNLALTYMKLGESRTTELTALMKTLEPDSAIESCQSLRAALHYVRGLYAFTQVKLHEAKRHLRETLLISNKSDLNRLTTCSLILLGQIFLSMGNTKETMDMVSPAKQLSSKIPDRKLQVWAATLLADLYHLTGDRENEFTSRQEASAIATQIQTDLSLAVQSKHHNLIQWTVGEWPIIVQPRPALHPTPHHQDMFTTAPTTSIISPPSTSSQSPKLKNKRRKTRDEDLLNPLVSGTPSLDPTALREGHASTDSDKKEERTKVSLKLRQDSPVHNSAYKANGSNSQSPTVLTNSDSPTRRISPLKTPELKLKKVTTPISAKPNRPIFSSSGFGQSELEPQVQSGDSMVRGNPVAPAYNEEQHYTPSAHHQDTLPISSSFPPSYSHHQQQQQQASQPVPLSQPLPTQHSSISAPATAQLHTPQYQYQQATMQMNESPSSFPFQPSRPPSSSSPALRADNKSPLNPAMAQHLSSSSPQGANLSPMLMQPQQQTRLSPSPVHNQAFSQQGQLNMRLKSLQPNSEQSPGLSSVTHHLNKTTPPLYLNRSPQVMQNTGDAERLHLQQYLAQKQLQEERLKQQQQQLMNSQQQQQLEHQKLLNQQQQRMEPVEKLMSHSSSAQQKYFPSQQAEVNQQSHDFLRQHLHRQQQQQQQQLLRQQVQIQQQYLLQQAGAMHPSYQVQAAGANYQQAVNPVAMDPLVTNKSIQMPQLTHMVSHQRLVQDQNRSMGTGDSSPPQRPVMHSINHHHHQYPAAFGQNVQLLPNGANLANSLTGQSNPTCSPLRHFNPH